MKYEPSLDGLRAIAILAVVLFHISNTYVPGGWAGVDIFFVLSGYLITSLLIDEESQQGTINFRNFYLRRLLRLAPALVCLLAFQVAVAIASPNPAHRVDYLRAAVLSGFYLMNWNRAFGWFSEGLLGHTWSLSMEEQFYLLWPLLFLFLRNKNSKRFLFIGIISIIAWRSLLAISGASAERTYNGFDTHSDGLLMGCFIAFMPWTNVKELARKTVTVPAIAILAIFLLLPYDARFTETIGLSIAAFFAAWIVIALQGDSWIKRFLSLKLLVYTGRISYGWYLWHYPILLLAKAHVSAHGRPQVIALDAAIFVFSYLSAMFSFRFIELPFLKIKRHFGFRTSERKEESSPAGETVVEPA